MKPFEYLYVFDFTTCKIYQINVTDDERETEEILESHGLKADDCQYMWSTEELEIIKQ